jgi:hypothetical protein
MTLLRNKRQKFATDCLDSKRPKGFAKHVGVEIEFVSKSDKMDIARDLAMYNLHDFVELKHDGSVEGDGDCQGDCRENCECAYCGDTHYCDDKETCVRQTKYNGSQDGNDRAWIVNKHCDECTKVSTIDDCDCGGNDLFDNAICDGHVICSGHCPGHYCEGSDDHPDYDCQCECDCSEMGLEIAVVAKSKDMPDILTKVCAVLKKHDAEVNHTCGLHVHLDARRHDQHKMFKNLVNSSKLLYAMVPASRSKNTYCRPNTSNSMTRHDCGRYWGVNPTSYETHKTIEVRLHSGSVNAEKILNWIAILQKLAYGKPVRAFSDLNELLEQVKMPTVLVNHIVSRVNAFQVEHINGPYAFNVEMHEFEQAA